MEDHGSSRLYDTSMTSRGLVSTRTKTPGNDTQLRCVVLQMILRKFSACRNYVLPALTGFAGFVPTNLLQDSMSHHPFSSIFETGRQAVCYCYGRCPSSHQDSKCGSMSFQASMPTSKNSSRYLAIRLLLQKHSTII